MRICWPSSRRTRPTSIAVRKDAKDQAGRRRRRPHRRAGESVDQGCRRVFDRRSLAEAVQRDRRRHLQDAWDYCCEADLPKATVLVMVVDEDGKIVKQDARELLGVKELDTVFIQGKAKRDKAGNVTILASKLFVPTDDERDDAMSAEVDIKQLAIVREQATAAEAVAAAARREPLRDSRRAARRIFGARGVGGARRDFAAASGCGSCRCWRRNRACRTKERRCFRRPAGSSRGRRRSAWRRSRRASSNGCWSWKTRR